MSLGYEYIKSRTKELKVLYSRLLETSTGSFNFKIYSKLFNLLPNPELIHSTELSITAAIGK